MRTNSKALLSFLLGCVVMTAAVALLADDDPGEKERDIPWKELPAAVQATISEQAGDHALVEIEEITSKDVVFFEVEWIEGENEVEIQVAVDGKLLGREVEALDDENDDEEDDEDDEEKDEDDEVDEEDDDDDDDDQN